MEMWYNKDKQDAEGEHNMGKDVISAKLDIIFKKIFSLDENEDLFHDFLSSLLEIPYNDIKKIEV